MKASFKQRLWLSVCLIQESVVGFTVLVAQPSTTGSDVMGQPSDDDNDEEEVVVVRRSRGLQGEAPKPEKDEKVSHVRRSRVYVAA